LIDSHHNGVEKSLNSLLLSLDSLWLSVKVGLEPLVTLLGSILNDLLVISGEPLLELLVIKRVLNLETVVLEGIPGFNANLKNFILFPELFTLINHALKVFLRETIVLVDDCDIYGIASAIFGSRDLQKPVYINIEFDLDLGDTTRTRCDALKYELA
jgi:hypothetical protein